MTPELELAPEQLRKTCDPLALGLNGGPAPDRRIIGQERATRALKFGLGIKAVGFNVFVAGAPGTGRTTAVRTFLEQAALEQSLPPDWCYVNNFRDPSAPNAISLPTGTAAQFRSDMQDLLAHVQREIRKVFDSDEYAAKRAEVEQSFTKKREEIEARLNHQAQEAGFVIQASPMGIMTVPVRKGHPLTEEQFRALEQAEKDEIARKQEELQAEIEAALRQMKALSKKANSTLQQLDQQVGLFAINPLMQDLREKYQGVDEVSSYLEQVQDDFLDNLDDFRSDQQEEKPATPFAVMTSSQDALFNRYQVNVLVDNSGLKGAPVVIELNPTYGNLFGRVEHEAQFGTLVTNYTLVRAGSLHHANGGYLVLPAEEVLRAPFAWDGLKRALRNRQIAMEDPSERLGLPSTRRLQPEPVPLDVKVVLIGQNFVYHLLRTYDEDFGELFKVKADFDTQMPRTDDSLRDYAHFAGVVCTEAGLKTLDAGALAALVEHGSRLAEDQSKLSTRFGELADVIREAGYYAAQMDVLNINSTHLLQSIDEKYYRSSLVRERLREMVGRGVLLVDVQGEQTGQVNGLSVLDLGDIAFGQPSRITASIAVGRDGLMDIERQADLGGPLHTKGVLILAGYLAGKFAQERPLALAARLVFEQSYGGVDGDSASSAELYALLSGLSGLPLRQGIAVTGSVNQKGEVQAIGGVNEKIEGFFEVCQLKGLDGRQGVLIPAANCDNLMLRADVVAAAHAGQFHIWAVQTIEQGIEVLTGVPAGQRGPDGNYPSETVFGRADQRLLQLGRALAAFGKDEKGENDKPGQAG